MTEVLKHAPLVSVVIPTYNRASFLGETIRSVIAQTYTNLEIIIVDDGSTDETENLIQNLTTGQIKYFKIPHSGSFAVVRNFGILKAHGDFIAFLDSDDLWEKEKIELQVNALSDSNCDFCFTQIFQFGSTAVKVPDYKSLQGKLLQHYLEEGHFAYYPSSLLFKKDVLATTGLLNDKFPFGADPEFFVTLCHHFNGIFLAEVLTKIRKHDNNTSIRDPLFSCPEMVDLLKRIYAKGFIRSKTFRSAISKFYYKMGLIQKGRRRLVSSFNYFALYVYYRPVHWKGWLRLIQVPLQIFLRPELRKSR
jgi:glycosyltransferase involved in cell wall biosynthesis